ncbi:MAG: Xaa-Pro peptidase family protein [Firmicutes bacterium]|nr:Xaa-Pro peptidase family protein [Bacillota bacterium]MDH7495477.1 Xaa-Pro peptidase family protein [Bacillota bacterium]
MRLTRPFYLRKIARCRQALADRGLDGLFILNHLSIWYLTGFFHFPTERPIGVFIATDEEVPRFFIPKLEEDQVLEVWDRDIETYFEYPGVEDPLSWMCGRLGELGYGRGRLGYESSISVGARDVLSAVLPEARWTEAGDIIAGMRLVKDEEEIELIRKAAMYSDFMVEEGVRVVKERGFISEIEILEEVVRRTVDKMLDELDPIVYVSGIAAGLVCSGERSAFPHGLPSKRRIRRGENLILSFGCVVGGYNAESERTVFVGSPSDEQRKTYEAVREAQEVGTMALRSGRPCRDANRVCLDVLRKAGLWDYVKHRQGHGIGISNHEPPWIEDGDGTILKPGMVVSSEPGIYVPGKGGYRVSDTVLITEAGPERLTSYPRDMEKLIIDL